MMKTTEKNENGWGGARPGAGRKGVGGADGSATVSFRVPAYLKGFLKETTWDWKGEFISRMKLMHAIQKKK